jgi:2-C-methyl-D-erythritol 4-phosphate cytidylyltransferase/2-C-methyl-D-erythritol 2,4-cyclodiphosphate synthase
LVLAAGQGIRAGAELPKQYRAIGGVPIVTRSLRLFLDHDAIDLVQVVIGAGHEEIYAATAPSHGKLRAPTIGGATRQQSVGQGLAALATAAPERVLIHDAARPFATPSLIDRVLASLDDNDAVIPALPVANTLKRVADGRVVETIPRDDVQGVQTPQGFAFGMIRGAYEKAAIAGREFTDDAGVAAWAGQPVTVVAGDPANIKITTAADIADADRRFRAEQALELGDVRVGVGYDVHALGVGSHVTLGGVVIPHTRGLVGHSDADVVLHALTDAVLGALGDGDIGVHFPPSDPRWKGVSSDRFLAGAVRRVKARGGIVAHLDVSLTAEGPRIAPHCDGIRARIAAIAGISIDRVGLQATTNEGLGFIGRGEGVAAHAVATIRLPYS